ncbi:ABC transporter substrate-binding protein [Actinokineospora soli]|uniref:ABC transporter substrate-binding protein n=1 Tax=Actinokineospora soli TaxID=1048753 RepID=A0ABW2TTD9_9PSEU
MNRRSLALAALGLAATLAVSACGSSDSADPGKDKGSKEFTYWSMWTENEPQAKVLKAAIDSFTKDTGIAVNVQWHGRDVLKKLTPTLRGTAAADLVDQSINQLGNGLSATGQSADLASVYDLEVPGEGKKVGAVIPERYHQFLKGADGKFFMVPYEITGEGVWFNAAAHPQFATEPPKTWEDFVADLDELKKSGVAPFALDADNPGAATYWPVLTLIRAVGPEGVRKLAGDKTGAPWDDPKVADAAAKLEALVKGGYFAEGYNASKHPAQQNAWAQGKAALILQGSWVPSESKTYVAPGFEFNSFQLPTINGGTDAVGVNFIGFGVPKSAEHGDAASKFIAYFLNKSRLEGIATQADNITPRDDIPAPKILESLQKAMAEKEVYPSQAGIGLLYGNWNSTVLQPNAQAFMQGRIGGAEYVQAMKTKTVEYWKTQG